jgi:DNA-binding NarL/FixJ family response regulator
MSREIRVLIIEDDPYACDLMAMLLARDWRTRVVAELGSNTDEELRELLKSANHHINLVILDTETPGDPRWPARAAEIILAAQPAPVLLYTCTHPLANVLEHLPATSKGGYLVKGEIQYALASAVCLAASGRWVITPGVEQLADKINIPKTALVLSSEEPAVHFTRRENDLLRLGILFNLSQRDIADELIVSTDFVSEVMGQIYEKLGLHEILAGKVPLEEYFTDEIVLAHCNSILKRAPGISKDKKLRKAPWMATLAFHLMTAPSVETLYPDR